MTEKEFMTRVADGKRDVLQEFVDILTKHRVSYCVIGGLAVNAYAEPVVSLDLDVIVAASDRDKLLSALPNEFRTRAEKHSTNISTGYSNLRIQLQTDERYQDFIHRARVRKVLGYDLSVASIEDVLQGKVWAYSDPERRASKRQKDFADILRLIETNPNLLHSLPPEVQRLIQQAP